ncbi:MAG: hypothetical protein MUP71_11645 [Candidatus Aminicenantes bacterium]|nr:hypothetical protein [Candidatus Aminicenantes bacterium]
MEKLSNKHGGNMDEMLSELLEKGQIKDLIPLPGDVFNRAWELIRRRHAEAQGFKYLDPEHPGYCESCEG